VNDHQFWLFWTVLVCVFLAGFIPVEAYAIATHRDKTDTLSAWVWKLIGTRAGWHWWNTPLRIVVAVLFLWLAEHFSLGYV